MAISNKFVNYSKTIPVPIYAPESYDPEKNTWSFTDDVVATYNMVSVRSIDGRAAVKQYVSERAKLQASLKKKVDGGKDINLDDVENLGELELNQVCACILSWDWTDEYFEGEGKPEFSIDEAVRISKDADWIHQQISTVPGNLGNFTNA